MANYNSYWRTNYFQVRDPECFRKHFAHVCGEDISLAEDKRGFCIYGTGGIDGILPMETAYVCRTFPTGENYALEKEVPDWDYDRGYDDFLDFLVDSVAENDAIIYMEAGHENLRYVAGSAFVVTSKGISFLDLANLAMKQAREDLGNRKWTTEMYY